MKVIHPIIFVMIGSLVTAQEKSSPESSQDRFARHKDNYFLLYTAVGYSGETKFQFSVKYRLVDKFNGYFGYTQKSFWNAWDFALSSPFTQSNYNPELFYEFFGYPFHGLLAFSFGVEHESNGRGDTISRAWNKIYFQPSMVFGDSVLVIRPKFWIPFLADKMNPDIREYLGYGELGVSIPLVHDKPERASFDVLFIKGASSHLYESGVQLALILKPFELLESLNVPVLNGSYYFQYYNGFGESLETYNQIVRRFRMGLILKR